MKTKNELLKIIGDSYYIRECLTRDADGRIRKIQAIKELRNISGMPLRESKEACDAWEQSFRYIPESPEMTLVAAGWIVRNILDRKIPASVLEIKALEIVSEMACNAIELPVHIPGLPGPYDDGDDDED